MRSLVLLLLSAGALPLAADDLRTGQLLTSGYYPCNRDATDARNGMNVYERTGAPASPPPFQPLTT